MSTVANAEHPAPSRALAVTTALLMATCAGAVDLWAITSLAGTYAGVATGNLVSVGRAAGEGAYAALVPPALAVGGFALGVAAWSFVWRHRPTAIAVPLVCELVVLTAAATVWIASGAFPSAPLALVLLVLTATAMGGQSAIALRVGDATTYMTGTLTTAVAAAASGRDRSQLVVLRQLLALVLGALIASLLLAHARWATPLPALVALVAALALRAARETLTRHDTVQEITP
ncbi:MAG TPA: DUF1275 family protein [Pseudonocardia sp.]